MSVLAETLERNMAVGLLVEPLESKLETGGERIHCFHPLTDDRWSAFLDRAPNASVFHSLPWLDALRRTYGYEIVAYTTSYRSEDLENAIIFCRINSWLTGRRLVSLPFSDHCAPLIDEESGSDFLAQILQQELHHKHSYVELRPLTQFTAGTSSYRTNIEYVFHQLDLTPALETLFRGFHQSSIQRKIRKAEKQELLYREGRSAALLDQFYTLFEQTRKRHHIPPPPREWFVNIMRSFGNALKIRIAYQGDRVAAGMITLQYKDTLVYKYGASDPQFHRFGAMHLLYWKAIQEAKILGLKRFDFGRTNADQQGLITFKNRWGATQSTLTYSRYSLTGTSTHFFDLYATKWKSRVAKCAISCLPFPLVSKVGQMLYRHIA